MGAGAMRHRVELQAKTTSHDDHGGPVQTWKTVATVWASLEATSTREFFAAQQVQSEVTQRIRIRFRADIDATMRVVHKDRVFDIVGILPNNRQTQCVLMCKERSNAESSQEP